MKKLITACLLASSLAAFAEAQEKKCFKNEGLKDSHIIYLSLDGAKASGEFILQRDYGGREAYPFSGKLSNGGLSIYFADGKFPYPLPPGAKNGSWAIKTADGAESLLIKTYGKNYETGKYSAYLASYSQCDPGYGPSSKNAQRISFAKGASSAKAEVLLAGKEDIKAFWLNLAKGQRFAVKAPGCGITFFYPDKRAYEEGTAIDTLGGGPLALGGDYLFLISMAGEADKCSVEFSAR